MYRSKYSGCPEKSSFLPVWEGVSQWLRITKRMRAVSSLYGRVFKEVFSMNWKDKVIIFLVIFFTLFFASWFSRSYTVPNEGDPCIVGIEQQT